MDHRSEWRRRSWSSPGPVSVALQAAQRMGSIHRLTDQPGLSADGQLQCSAAVIQKLGDHEQRNAEQGAGVARQGKPAMTQAGPVMQIQEIAASEPPGYDGMQHGHFRTVTAPAYTFAQGTQHHGILAAAEILAFAVVADAEAQGRVGAELAHVVRDIGGPDGGAGILDPESFRSMVDGGKKTEQIVFEPARSCGG